MKTAALHVLFIVSIIMCIGCESKPKNQILSYPPIQATDTLKHQIFPTEEVFGSAMCMFITDSLLIIEDYFNRDTSIWGIQRLFQQRHVHLGNPSEITSYGKSLHSQRTRSRRGIQPLFQHTMLSKNKFVPCL